MGNSVTVIKVHHGDGVSYYNPPIRVLDILDHHPECFVVSMSKGKRNILSSGVSLQPGRNYYLVSPDDLFSADCQIPADNAPSFCSQGCGKLYRVVAVYFASTKSLLAMLTPRHKHSKTKQETFESSVVIPNVEAGHQPVRKGALPIKDNSAEVPNLVKSLGLDASTAAGALILSEKSSLEYEQPDVWSRTTSYETECSSPEFLPLGHGMVAKVKEKRSTERFGDRFTANIGLESEIESSSCIPWKSVKRLPEDGGIVPQALSKEKWLEDMIRGADNQWKRNELQQRSMIAGFECSELEYRVEAKSWGLCLPSSVPLLKSTSKKVEYLDYSQSLMPGSSPGRSQEHSFDIAVVNHDQQLFNHEVHYRKDPQHDLQGASAKRVAKRALQPEIEQNEQLECDKKRVHVGSEHPLWLKMDEIERQFLLRPSPPASPPMEQNPLQRIPRKDASTRPYFLNFSRVDRG